MGNSHASVHLRATLNRDPDAFSRTNDEPHSNVVSNRVGEQVFSRLATKCPAQRATQVRPVLKVREVKLVLLVQPVLRGRLVQRVMQPRPGRRVQFVWSARIAIPRLALHSANKMRSC